MGLFEENVAVLSNFASDRSLRCLQDSFDDDYLFEVDNANAEKPLFYISRQGGGRQLLQSRRQPRVEAERQIALWGQGVCVDWEGVIVVNGFAGLYHADIIMSKLGAKAVLVFVETRPWLLRQILAHCALRDVLSSVEGKEVYFIISEDKRDIEEEFKAVVSSRDSLCPFVFTPPSIKRIFADNGVEKELFYVCRRLLYNRGTSMYYQGEWQQYAMFNLPFSLKAAGVGCFKGRFKGHDAIVCAAGPSLDSAVPYIKKRLGSCVVFAVGTALKSLLHHGIEPDFVVVVDSIPSVLKQFKDIESRNSILLTHHFCLPQLMQAFAGRAVLFSANLLEGFMSWVRPLGSAAGYLRVGGTVTVSAVDAAAYMGCCNIILTGLDLSFPLEGKSHASGSSYDDYAGNRWAADKLFPVVGNYGKKVYTTPLFSQYIDAVGRYVAELKEREGVAVFNATLQGALIAGVELISPDYIQKYGNDSLQKSDLISAALGEGGMPSAESCVGYMNSTLAELKQLRLIAQEGLGVIDELLKHVSSDSMSGMLERLAAIDEGVKQCATAMLLVADAIKPIIEDIKRRPSGGQRDSFLQSQKLYSHIHGSADWLYGMLEIALKGYERGYHFDVSISDDYLF